MKTKMKMNKSGRVIALVAVFAVACAALVGFGGRSTVYDDPYELGSDSERYSRIPGTGIVIDVEKGPYAMVDEYGDLVSIAQLQRVEGFTFNANGPVCYGRWSDFLQDLELSTTNATYTVTGSTAPTTVTHAVGGSAVFTNAAADNDRIEVSETSEWVKLELGKSYRFVFRGNVDAVTSGQTDIGFGLGVIDTDWLGDAAVVADGLFFEVNDGDTNLDLVTIYNGGTYVRDAALVALTDATNFRVVLDVIMDRTTAGKGRIRVWVDGVLELNALRTGLPYDEELCLMYGIQNGAAEAQVLTIDYIGAAGDRTN